MMYHVLGIFLIKVWIPTSTEEALSGDILEEWLKKGPKKLSIDNETNFVDPNILQGIINAKVFLFCPFYYCFIIR